MQWFLTHVIRFTVCYLSITPVICAKIVQYIEICCAPHDGHVSSFLGL